MPKFAKSESALKKGARGIELLNMFVTEWWSDGFRLLSLSKPGVLELLIQNSRFKIRKSTNDSYLDIGLCTLNFECSQFGDFGSACRQVGFRMPTAYCYCLLLLPTATANSSLKGRFLKRKVLDN